MIQDSLRTETFGLDSRIYEIHPCISAFGPAKKRPLKKAPVFFNEPVTTTPPVYKSNQPFTIDFIKNFIVFNTRNMCLYVTKQFAQNLIA